MTEKEFEEAYGKSFADTLNEKETIDGIDFYTLPLSTNVCINNNGYRFALLKPYKKRKYREKAIVWALEQFRNDTLKPVKEAFYSLLKD